MPASKKIPAIPAGAIYGRLTTIRQVKNHQDRHVQWECQCSCGVIAFVTASTLRNGRVRSCGCIRKEGKPRHGHARKGQGGHSLTYEAWCSMKRRCNDSTLKGSENYHGRKITYDSRWESFEHFLEDMGEVSRGMTLDRIDNNGNYSKNNCRWADRKTQNRNRRDTILWTDAVGNTMSLHEAVEKYSHVGFHTVYYRLLRGWNALDALLSPKGTRLAKR